MSALVRFRTHRALPLPLPLLLLPVAGAGGVLIVLLGPLPLPLPLVAVLPAAVLLSLAATRCADAALAAGLALVVVVPFYAGPYVAGSLAVTPMTAVALALLPAAWLRRHDVRLVALDGAVAVLVLLRAVSYLLNFAGGAGAAAGLVLGTALPYVVLRLLTARHDLTRLTAGALVAGSVPVSLVALGERVGAGNLFFTLLPAGYQAEQWARPELRFGVVRAEASFGSPLAFGLFLALVLVLGLALALTTTSQLTRAATGAAGVLALLALVATLSRGPLLAAGLGCGLWLLLTLRSVAFLRLLALLAGLALVVVVSPAAPTVAVLFDQSQGDTAVSRSAEFRLQVLAVTLDPDQQSLLGRPTPDDGGLTASLVQRTGLKSVDSEYALVFLASGTLALIALVSVALLCVRTALRPGIEPVERAWASGLSATAVALLVVALLTQHSELFWAGIAVVAGIDQRSRERSA